VCSLYRLVQGGPHTGKPSDRYVPAVLIAFQTPSISSGEQVYSSFQVDSIKLLELLGPEKVDPSDVKLIKEKLFGYSTFWVTREEPFGDLGEGILFLGNLRGKRENVFAKLQQQLHEVTGDKYNLFMVEEPNSEGLDPRGGPRVSFGLLRKEVSEPGPTTLWQYVIALLLFVLTIGSCVELGIASQINTLPPEVVKYFTDPNATEPPDMQLLYPFVDSALPLAYGVLGVQLFHVTKVSHMQLKKTALFSAYILVIFLAYEVCGLRCVMCGLTTSAFNMLPVGCLDGGRAIQVQVVIFKPSNSIEFVFSYTMLCDFLETTFFSLSLGGITSLHLLQGAFGKNTLFGFGLATYSLLGLGVLGGPLSLPWGLYVLICQVG
ncbi:hypothetical protein B296_00022168, partial [Ensete ventricosum]